MGNPIVCFVGLIFFSLTGFSQSILRGKVTDGKSGEPVPFANVFFSNTTMGSPTLENGTFEIKNIPNGKYDLTVSMVGYKRFQQAIEFQGADRQLLIVLDQELVNLSEVTIYADQADYKKYFPAFKKYFLGESVNSVQCVIMNPTDIFLYFDPKTQVLTGHASRPIIIENKGWGSRVHYILDLFELNFKNGWKKLSGIARFEELPPVHERRTRQWNKRRDVAYRGSLNHFMRSLYNNSSKKEGFDVMVVDTTALSEDLKNVSVDSPIELSEHISGTDVKSFKFKGTLKVVYRKEFEDYGYRKSRTMRINYFQASSLKFTSDAISIFENGYYVNQRSVFLDGYLAWAESIGEFLPHTYYPTEEK